MDQRQGQAPGPPPIVPNPHGMAPVANSQQQMAAPTQAVASHLMELMTNPALAAAAASSPLFPPAAMLSNPGALFAMPQEYYNMNRTANANSQNINGAIASGVAANGGSAVMPQLQSARTTNNNNGNAYTDGTVTQQVPLASQGTQQQQQQHVPVNLSAQSSSITYGAMPVPAVAQQSQNQGIQAQVAAAAAAAAAAEAVSSPAIVQLEERDEKGGRRKKDLSPAERAKQNRDRNREHARSTRLRKKVYIQKLKELVEGLHAERTEEVRQRRVAIQHLAEMQNVRRAVIRSFLRFHSGYEKDVRKWSTLLEDSFWLKQPVTPYRCFRRREIDEECRISRGVEGVIADAASVAVMIEGVGSRSTRWMQIKREDFFIKEEERTGTKHMPRNIVRQNGRFQHAVSSLSSSSGSSNNGSSGSSGEEANKKKKQRVDQSGGRQKSAGEKASEKVKNGNGAISGSQSVSNLSGSSNEARANQQPSEHFHDYHAQPLPDPKLADSERSSTSASDDSPEESNNGSAEGDTKRVSTDSSSGDDSAAAIKDSRPHKRRKTETGQDKNTSRKAPTGHLPLNIAKQGGISHNVRPVATIATSQSAVRNVNSRLSMAPAIPLPPFAGIGKRLAVPTVPPAVSKQNTAQVPNQGQAVVVGNVQVAGLSKIPDPNEADIALADTALDGPAVISGDVETSSSNSSRNRPQIRAVYHLNEDDMILMDDVLMCPFVFRTQDAVMCGALAECVMPGMLRGHFSARNKLLSLEMVYDAMGFMQQLERASGSEVTAQIIPGSLEMALSPTTAEARVITLAEAPFLIVNVNEVWTRMTKYTQMEVEGKELTTLLLGENSGEDSENSTHNWEDVVQGRCTCSTALNYDKEGREFVNFTQSYPLTNTSDEITHVLHVSKELPPLQGSLMEEIT